MTSEAAERVPNPTCNPATTVVCCEAAAPGHDQVLINEILKLQAPAAKARCAGVGEVVGDIVQVGFLGGHAAGGSVKGANHPILLRRKPKF